MYIKKIFFYFLTPTHHKQLLVANITTQAIKRLCGAPANKFTYTYTSNTLSWQFKKKTTHTQHTQVYFVYENITQIKQ